MVSFKVNNYVGCRRHNCAVCFCCLFLQNMLDICYIKGTEIDIVFNAKKSSLFLVGKAYDETITDLKIDHNTVVWSRTLKYLGVYIRAYSVHCITSCD